MNGLRIAVRKQALPPPFPTYTALLMALQIASRMRPSKGVDPEGTSLQLAAKPLCCFCIP